MWLPISAAWRRHVRPVSSLRSFGSQRVTTAPSDMQTLPTACAQGRRNPDAKSSLRTSVANSAEPNHIKTPGVSLQAQGNEIIGADVWLCTVYRAMGNIIKKKYGGSEEGYKKIASFAVQFKSLNPITHCCRHRWQLSFTKLSCSILIDKDLSSLSEEFLNQRNFDKAQASRGTHAHLSCEWPRNKEHPVSCGALRPKTCKLCGVLFESVLLFCDQSYGIISTAFSHTYFCGVSALHETHCEVCETQGQVKFNICCREHDLPRATTKARWTSSRSLEETTTILAIPPTSDSCFTPTVWHGATQNPSGSTESLPWSRVSAGACSHAAVSMAADMSPTTTANLSAYAEECRKRKHGCDRGPTELNTVEDSNTIIVHHLVSARI